MKPNKRGWLKRYMQRMKSFDPSREDFRKIFDGNIQGLNFESSVYKLIQPTGLMYGYPLQNTGIVQPAMHRWEDKEKMKFILLDSFVNTTMVHHRQDLINSNDLEAVVHEAATRMNQFYQDIYPDLPIKKKHFFGKNKDEFRMAEDLLHNRFDLNNKWQGNFWYRFFENSLLFLDIFYFGHYLQKDNQFNNLLNSGLDPESMRLLILKIIAVAANADEKLTGEEKNLFQFFLHSAHLSPSRAREATDFLTDFHTLDQISLEQVDSWLLKKYILELAILTIWADKKVESSEKEMVNQLKEKLSLQDEDVEYSMLAIEGFVLENSRHIHFLQDKHSFFIVKKMYEQRVGSLITYNRKAIIQEIRESRELWTLMEKARKNGLTPEEKQKVQTQLLDILKCLPPFVIMVLPGTFFTLPMMIKLLPKSAFPSSFQDEV